jgi:hypothetical protein
MTARPLLNVLQHILGVIPTEARQTMRRVPLKTRPEPSPHSCRPDDLDRQKRQAPKQPVEVNRTPPLELTDLPECRRSAPIIPCGVRQSVRDEIRDRTTEAMPSPTRPEVPLLAIKIPAWRRQREHREPLTVNQPRQEERHRTPLPVNGPTVPAATPTTAKVDTPSILNRVERMAPETLRRDPSVRN